MFQTKYDNTQPSPCSSESVTKGASAGLNATGALPSVDVQLGPDPKRGPLKKPWRWAPVEYPLTDQLTT